MLDDEALQVIRRKTDSTYAADMFQDDWSGMYWVFTDHATGKVLRRDYVAQFCWTHSLLQHYRPTAVLPARNGSAIVEGR